MKKCLLLILYGVALLTTHKSTSQKVIQDQKTITANFSNNNNGIASGSVTIDYIVREIEGEAVFFIAYSNITVNTTSGYYYKGKKYGSEVPGLIDKLGEIKGTYPKIHFDVYYKDSKKDFFIYSISAQNLGLYTGDQKAFPASREELNDPQWYLIATDFESFNYTDVTIGMAIKDLILKYENERKASENYNALIKKADNYYKNNQLEDALVSYLESEKNQLATDYPTNQIEKIKTEIRIQKNENHYKNLMAEAAAAERNNDYVSALNLYSNAATIADDDYAAKNGIFRVQNALEHAKKEDEKALSEKKKAEAEKMLNIQNEQEIGKETLNTVLNKKSEDLEQRNNSEWEKIKDNLDEQDRKKLQDARTQQIEKIIAEKKQRFLEDETRMKNEKIFRRETDQKIIKENETNMSYDPESYKKWRILGDDYFEKGSAIKPHEALNIDDEWWNSNPYMETFRDDLNEPKRREAYNEYQMLLYEMQGNYDMAKNYYQTAIKYTDRNSKQHLWLLSQIEKMNLLLDFQKNMIHSGQNAELERQTNYENAKIFNAARKLENNSAKASVLYSSVTFGQIYPAWGTEETNQAVQQQIDFERRLNEADQQLKKDQLITGLTTQVVTDALTDNTTSNEVYGQNDMGVNFFALTGFATYPIVVNDTPLDGYIPETFIEGLKVIPFQAGFDFWFHRGKIWDLGLTPDVQFGVLPMLGNSNVLLNYGANLKINIGFKRVKLAMELDYHGFSGSYEYDQDVYLSQFENQQPTNRILVGEFNYNTTKAGLGVDINFADEYNDGYVRMLLYVIKPSFYTDFQINNPIMALRTNVVFRGGFTLLIDYAQNYPAGGKAENVMTTFSSKDLASISFGKTWTIGKTNKN